MKYSILFFLTLLVVCEARAQEFKSKAFLKPVDQTGFYQLAITPELSAHSKSDLSDIRILDEKNRQVPYLIRTSSGVSIQEPFIELPVLSIQTDSNKTKVEIDARKLEQKSSLSLQIGNNAVERFTSISGSNDQKTWYIIDERIGLRNNGAEGKGHFVQSIEFPVITYGFLKLNIHNGDSDPLNILKAGVYGTSKKTLPVFVENPAPFIRQVDSANGKTYVFVQQQQPYLVDRLTVSITGSPFYKREARVFVPGNLAVSSHTITRFRIASDQVPVIDLDGNHYSSFVLEIENGDSPPLIIENVSLAQVQKHLVVYLEPGKQYTLMTENPVAASPRYDLHHFNDQIPQTLAFARYGPLVQNSTTEVTPPLQTKSVMWVIIGVGILILGFLSYRLINDMKHR